MMNHLYTPHLDIAEALYYAHQLSQGAGIINAIQKLQYILIAGGQCV